MEENQSLLDLEVDSEVTTNLIEVSKWGKFLGIVVLTGMGLFVLLFFSLWSSFAALFSSLGDDSGEGAGTIVMILFAFILLIVCAVVVVLMMFLVKGAAGIRKGLLNKDQITFNIGLANLKNYFVMYGILGIIGLFFALIGFLSR
jgi:hypothetical protein